MMMMMEMYQKNHWTMMKSSALIPVPSTMMWMMRLILDVVFPSSSESLS